jgi:hypothetical protein
MTPSASTQLRRSRHRRAGRRNLILGLRYGDRQSLMRTSGGIWLTGPSSQAAGPVECALPGEKHMDPCGRSTGLPHRIVSTRPTKRSWAGYDIPYFQAKT